MIDGFIPSVTPQKDAKASEWLFVYGGHKLLVRADGASPEIPLIEGGTQRLTLKVLNRHHLGVLHGYPCWAVDVESENEAPPGMTFRDLRSLFSDLEESFFRVAVLAVHIIEWDRTSRFCGRCRGELKARTDVRAKECPDCGRLEFPRLSPAIIVLIQREDEILLARSARFVEGFFSVLAGFVEPGESLEEAVRREVMEEVGISVKEIKYFGSQPWPFPDSLMIGFTARYESGEIQIDGEEIVEAGWYGPSNLPKLAGKISIARQLIDSFLEKHSPE
jgi:NAD+ diphosphatase